MAKQTKITVDIELPDGRKIQVVEVGRISDLPGALLRVAAAASARIREVTPDPNKRNSGPNLLS